LKESVITDIQGGLASPRGDCYCSGMRTSIAASVLALAFFGASACDDSGPEQDDVPDGEQAPDAQPVADGSSVNVDARVLPDFAPFVPGDAAVDGPPRIPDAGLPPQGLALAEQNMWGPMARVTALDIPETPVAARAAGCLVEGKSAGSAVRNLIVLAGGGLDEIVEPDGDGLVATVLFFRAVGWPVGESALDLEHVDFEFYEGAQDADLAFVLKGAEEAGEAADPRAVFAATAVKDGWIQTVPADLRLPVSLALAPGLALPLSGARISGRLAADDPGFRVDRGILTGYLTFDGAVQLVREIVASCRSDEPPGLCDLLGGQVDRPVEEIVGIVVGVLGGYEVRYDGNRAVRCNPAEEDGCNAVAMCARISARGVEVVGVEP
jgi:hypothetical protein